MTKLTPKTRMLTGSTKASPPRGEMFHGLFEDPDFQDRDAGYAYVGLMDTIDPLWEKVAVTIHAIINRLSDDKTNIPQTAESYDYFISELERIRKEFNQTLIRMDQEMGYSHDYYRNILRGRGVDI